ncbi:hypothetical protein [Desulfovibrio aminophilus]|uniref:hypothetical protein n=1 Tax=Desulfovibrio aminophilus TaxID=81425 RepID=UPI000408980A|nr:hypothetical protein [Desulfovibrio aminophilus]
MSLWIHALIGGLALLGLAVIVALLARRRIKPPSDLPNFDFDKNKNYEKEGRKFPFSY